MVPGVSAQDPEPQAQPGSDDEAVHVTVYEAVGGEPFFISLIDEFYSRVAADELLAPSYPDDLTRSKWDLSRFLMQYWGGPTTYSDAKGHPRLRMRHGPFSIGMAERNAWLRHMMGALDVLDPPDEPRRLFDQYFEQASLAMINQPV